MKTRICLLSLAVAPVIFCLSVSAAPPKPTVTVPSTALKTYDLADFIVGNIPVVDTPFNPRRIMLDASFAVPGGKVMKVPGYPNHDVKGGALVWHVRYAPPAAGSYTGTVTVTMPDGATSSDPFTFTVAQGTSKGFIRVAKSAPTTLEYENGTAYIGIGHDLTQQNKNWSSLNSKLTSLGGSGGNWVRQWTSFYWSKGVFIEGAHPYQYADSNGAQIDNFLSTCQQNGVYCLLCMEHVRNITGDCSASDAFCDPTFPYGVKNGGPCSTDDEMFTNKEAQTMFEARVRYFIARWGAYTSLFAWEFWNEIGGMSAALNGDIAVVWHDTMGQYTHRLDPYGHPTLTEFSWAFGVKGIDIISAHLGTPGFPIGNGLVWIYQEAAKAMPGYYDAIDSYGKPYIATETAICDDNFAQSPYYSQDATGYIRHEELWGPPMISSCASGMEFWWGTVNANSYAQYAIFSKAMSDVPMNKGWTSATATTSVANLTPFARTGAWGSVAWFWDNTANWESQVIDKKTPRTITGGTATIPVPVAGSYSMSIVNTWTGAVLQQQDVTATGTSVQVSLPSFTVDIFVKLYNKSWMASAISAPLPVNKVRPFVSIAGRTIDVPASSTGSLTISMFDARGVKVFETRGSRVCTFPARVAAGCYAIRLKWPGGSIERAVALAR